jgi:hypothetical protein
VPCTQTQHLEKYQKDIASAEEALQRTVQEQGETLQVRRRIQNYAINMLGTFSDRFHQAEERSDLLS